MGRCAWLVAAIALIAAALCNLSCDTKNVGTGVPSEWLKVTVSVPATMNADVTSTWWASWEGGVGPFTIFWDFGGGAENIGPEPATSPDTRTVEMHNPSTTDFSDFQYAVTVTDSNGIQATATGSYTVGGYPPPRARIESVQFEDGVLTVTVSEWTSNYVSVTPSAVTGLSFSPSSVVVPDGNGDALFYWAADDIFTGGEGTTTITADTGTGFTDAADQFVFIEPIQLEADTVYVIPLSTHAAVGEPVTYTCATGKLPNPFQFLNGVGVTIEDDADYVSYSWNVGKRGGGAGDVDGTIWTAVNPSGFLIADNLIQATQASSSNSIPEGRERWGFNVTGLGGSDIEGAEGILFNFQFTFSEPGLKRVGLQAVDGVNRSYYSDSTSTEYLWGTLMADEYGNLNVEGVDNTVLVE